MPTLLMLWSVLKATAIDGDRYLRARRHFEKRSLLDGHHAAFRFEMSRCRKYVIGEPGEAYQGFTTDGDVRLFTAQACGYLIWT